MTGRSATTARLLVLVVLVAMMACLALSGCSGSGSDSTWSVTLNGNVLEIAYGSDTDFPQYAALHLDSSYLRMNYGSASAWGTSVVLMPAFWSGGTYYQGAPITQSWQVSDPDLIVTIHGTIGNLTVQGTVRFRPPAANRLIADVSLNSSGTQTIDEVAGEGFKPVMLSSMHISSSSWDASHAYASAQLYPLPTSGWIMAPPATANVFGLKGGTSSWKTNAPTIEVQLDSPMTMTGWVTQSSDPNDDNVGLWPTYYQTMSSWHYYITAKP